MYCRKCGAKTDENGTCPKCDAQSHPKSEALWNPNAVANWSLLFTPIFGAWLTYLNWQGLGEAAYAKKSKYWLIASIALLFPLGVLINVTNNIMLGISAIGGYIALLLSWFYIENRKQNRCLNERFGKDYPKKHWLKPLVIAILASVIWQLAIWVIWWGNQVSRAPKCDAAEVQSLAMQVATQIIQDELLHQYLPSITYSEAKKSESPFIKGYADQIDKQIAGLGMMMKGIRPTGTDEKIRKNTCAASLAFSNGNTLNLYYSTQYTTDGQIYVEAQIK
jgi:hypothetical protein